VAEGATFSTVASDGALYATSEGLWSLTGDFRVVIGIDTASYYDEYRSATSFGLNACFGSGYNVRAAVATNYGDTAASYQALYSDGGDPSFFGWKEAGAYTSTGLTYDYLTLERAGSTINVYAGSYLIGSVSGVRYVEDCYIKIGSECTEANTFIVKATYFTVDSGALASGPSQFSSDFRGDVPAFPEQALLVVDGLGVSIVDYNGPSLWARVRVGPGLALPSLPSRVDAAEGRVYCATGSGLYVLDFENDVVHKYTGKLHYESINHVVSRNAHMTYTSSVATAGLLSDTVYDVSARVVSGVPFAALATEGGINVVVGSGEVFVGLDGSTPTTSVHITEAGSLFWGGTDSDGQGELSYLSALFSLTTATGTSFGRTGYFDRETAGFALSTSRFTHLSSAAEGLSTHLAIAHPAGIDVLLYPPARTQRVEAYSVVTPTNPFSDPAFESLLGLYWKSVRSRSQPIATASLSSGWSTVGTSSLRLHPGNPNISDYFTVPGDYSGVYQRVDLTGVSRIYFDIKLVAPADWFWTGQCLYQIRAGGTVLAEYAEPVSGEFTRLSESVDVSSYTGIVDFMVVVSAVGSSIQITDRYAYFDNFRTKDFSSQYELLGGTSSEVLTASLIFQDGVGKVVYTTPDGYGVFDLDDKSSDFFLGATSSFNLQSASGGALTNYGTS